MCVCVCVWQGVGGVQSAATMRTQFWCVAHQLQTNQPIYPLLIPAPHHYSNPNLNHSSLVNISEIFTNVGRQQQLPPAPPCSHARTAPSLPMQPCTLCLLRSLPASLLLPPKVPAYLLLLPPKVPACLFATAS